MDVAEFYQWIRDTLNRGATLDSVIPHYIRAAVREIENKRDWQKLEWWASFTLTPSDDPVISLPSKLKQIEFLRYDISDTGKRAKWRYMHRANPEKVISRVSDNPELYWINERNLLSLDAKLDSENRDFEIRAYRYSDWPDENAGDGVSHWLLDAMPAGLHARVIMSMFPYVRNEGRLSYSVLQNLYREAMMDLEDEEERSREANKSAEMVYWPEHIPYSYAFEDTED